MSLPSEGMQPILRPPTTPVLVVGQVPPPFHGQAFMIKAILDGEYSRVELHHVEMDFSRDMTDIGRFRFGKIAHLVAVVLEIYRVRCRSGARVLYYPPAGHSKAAVYRDVAILPMVRWLFDATVFHYHAEGLSSVYEEARRPLRALMARAYGRAEVAIRMAPFEGTAPRLIAKREVTIPYGVDDVRHACDRRQPPRILFVGTIRESKGVEVLLASMAELKHRGVEAHLELVGVPDERAYEAVVRRKVVELGLADRVTAPGLLTGDAKLAAFDRASVFAFPTHYESEAFPVVLIEAMRASLPVVATRWRSIPAMVDDGITGVLVPPHDASALADGLERVLTDGMLMRTMGENGRRRFEAHYTMGVYRSAIEKCLSTAASSQVPHMSGRSTS